MPFESITNSSRARPDRVNIADAATGNAKGAGRDLAELLQRVTRCGGGRCLLLIRQQPPLLAIGRVSFFVVAPVVTMRPMHADHPPGSPGRRETALHRALRRAARRYVAAAGIIVLGGVILFSHSIVIRVVPKPKAQKACAAL